MFKDGQILYMTYRSCLWGVDEVVIRWDKGKPILCEGMGWGGVFYYCGYNDNGNTY